jgi:hypothetical protein
MRNEFSRSRSSKSIKMQNRRKVRNMVRNLRYAEVIASTEVTV